MSRRTKENAKRAAECMLAVVLVCALMIPAGVSGVFAKESNASEAPTASAVADNEAAEGPQDAPATAEDELEGDPADQDAQESDTQVLANAAAESEANAEPEEQAVDLTTYKAWTVTQGDIAVSGDGVQPATLSVATSTSRDAYAGDKFVVCGYSISADSDVPGPVVIAITDCGIMSDDTSLEVWKVDSGTSTKLDATPSVIEGRITFEAESLGEYLVVSNVASVDLAKGDVNVTFQQLSGKQQDGTEFNAPFSDDGIKKYRIAQSDNEKRVTNCVYFPSDDPYTEWRTVIFDGLNSEGFLDAANGQQKSSRKCIDVDGTTTKLVRILLRNSNQLHHISYYTGDHSSQSESFFDNNNDSRLTIDSYTADGSTAGELYVPYKMANREEELRYVRTKGSSIGPYWSMAGIGARGSGRGPNSCTGLTIAGGTLRVLTTNWNGATAIGGGGNGDAQVSITGGDVTAISSCTGSAIGGGIGWTNRGGNADVSITGGTVYAENVDYYTRYSDTYKTDVSYGGVAIGSGSSMALQGNKADINISGDAKVTAYARYGNAIGSGNSYRSSAAQANISISGNSAVTTNALGGGTSKESQGGSASISVADKATVNCIKYSDIEDKWDPETTNELGAFGIGGGNSAGTAKGGSAVVNVSGGTLNCNGGNIGGGDATGTGDGGDASITVSGGTLDCASIGGGNSVTGAPGAVTGSDADSAGVVVTGGTLRTGTIGGGVNSSGAVGFATADISGGDIQGQFVLANTDASKQCFFKMTGGTIDNTNLTGDTYRKAQENGGAVYLSDSRGRVDISGGTIKNSSARLGGAVYMTSGTFTLSGNAEITNCQAIGLITTSGTELAQGGAVYLENGSVVMNGGCILNSVANQGGAVYLGSGEVRLSNGTIGKDGSPNTANRGAGVYVAGGTLTVDGGSVDHNKAYEGAGAYLQNGTMVVSGGQLQGNIAGENGAGAYLAGGTMTVAGGMVSGNTATSNGGGVYLASGDLAVSGGSITGNQAVDGAGAYLQSGNLNLSGHGDFSHNTASQNGAGAYLAGGALTLDAGTFNSNTAAKNGGGAYLAGGVLTINNGSIGSNSAQNGGGAYAADGKVRMFGGLVTNNTATADGGGLYVSSVQNAADVVIRSGSVTGNTSGGNGGGIAVMSDGRNAEDKVVLGLLETHPNLQSDRSFDAFEYNDTVDEAKHNHASCPVLSGDTATGDGGGVYMGSSSAELDIYCLTEKDNHSEANANGNSVMTIGGTVTIGDKNHIDENARGNVVIDSAMLVEGGTVDIWGNMQNPLFENNILVDIQANAGKFEDHRQQAAGNESYKVHYFENFTNGGAQAAAGLYTAIQYEKNQKVPALGTLFTHTGWKIVGWDTKADGTGTRYNIGSEIGNENDHSAWGNKNEPLVLYAIWERTSYTVVFKANAPAGTTYSGMMSDQKFEYGVEQLLTPNAFKITGKRFINWNSKADGTDMAYEDGYKASQITSEDGRAVDLYAQWADCTHLDGDHPGTVTYKASGTTITETCDCGYTASVTLSAVGGYYDQAAHPARLDFVGTLLKGVPTINYEYKADKAGAYGALPNGETVPVSVGYYKASITVGEEKVSVEYEIASPTVGISLSAKAAAGQYFADFNGDKAVGVSQDDAFTVQFDVRYLNTEVYRNVPQLSFGTVLPGGTTIIMQTGEAYWYVKSPAAEKVALTDFVKMGGAEMFQYTANETQTYRFIVDFSQANAVSGTSAVSLVYEPTGAYGELTDSISLTTQAKQEFSLSASGENLTINAPASSSTNRWYGKGLTLVLTAPGDIPADATLTVNIGDKTTVAVLNPLKQFVVPLDWAESQTATLKLSSDLAAKSGKEYKLKTALFAGVSGTKLFATEGTADVSLTIPASTSPSLKLSGTTRVVSVGDQALTLDVDMKNVDGCVVSAIIQKKTGSDYNGNYLTVDSLPSGTQPFSLAAITQPGSYRVYATVSKDGRTLMNVPYYFVVK